MRDFFYISNFQTPHLETDLELIQVSLDKGNEVFVLTCSGKINTCIANTIHNLAVCKICNLKVQSGLSLIQGAHLLHQIDIGIELPEMSLFKTLEDIREFKYDNQNLGIGILSSLISTTRDHQFSIKENFELIQRSFQAAILNYENFKAHIDDIKPDNVYLFNGRFTETYPLLEYCRNKGVKYFTHERGASNERYMLRENSIPHSINYTIKEIETLWERAIQSEREKIGKIFFEERIKGIEQNWISFSKNQIRNKLPENFTKEKINIAIFNSSLDEYETIPDFKSLIYKDDNDGIDRICTSFKSESKFHFYLRVHPNLKGLNNTQIKEIIKLDQKHENLTVIYPEEKIDSYFLIQKSEAIITFNSTIGVESMYLGTPSILLGRSFYEELKGIIRCQTHSEAVQTIKKIQVFTTESSTEYLKYGYWAKTFGKKYKYFVPKSLFTGTFKGKDLSHSNIQILIWRILKKLFYY